MSKLDQTIGVRHGRDRWRDALFIVAAVLVTAISIGAVTSHAVPKNHQTWSLTVIESNLEIGR